MKKVILSLFLLSLLSLGACSITGSSTGPALVVVTTEGQYSNNNVELKKETKSCQYNILGLINFGDTSIETTTRVSGIKNVGTIDRDYLGILGLFGKSCLIINGN